MSVPDGYGAVWSDSHVKAGVGVVIQDKRMSSIRHRITAGAASDRHPDAVRGSDDDLVHVREVAVLGRQGNVDVEVCIDLPTDKIHNNMYINATLSVCSARGI